MVALRHAGARIHFTVRVTTRAGRDAVGGEREGALLVRVSAPPADGAANAAVSRALADALDLPPSEVRIEHGARSRMKTVSIPAAAAEALARMVK